MGASNISDVTVSTLVKMWLIEDVKVIALMDGKKDFYDAGSSFLTCRTKQDIQLESRLSLFQISGKAMKPTLLTRTDL